MGTTPFWSRRDSATLSIPKSVFQNIIKFVLWYIRDGVNARMVLLYSLNGVIPGLEFLQKPSNLGHSWFTAQSWLISSVHRMVIEKDFHVLCVLVWCAAVSHETLVRRFNPLWQYLVLLPLIGVCPHAPPFPWFHHPKTWYIFISCVFPNHSN